MQSFRKRMWFLAALAAVAVLSTGTVMTQAGGPADETLSEVLDADEFFVTGISSLVRTDKGVSLEVSTTGLEPGAYTCWFVVFNHPENCGYYDVLGPGSCGIDLDDFLPASVGGTTGFGFTYCDGKVVDDSGEATFAGHLQEGTVLLNDFLEEDEIFEDARTAEIHAIVRYHGPADPGRIYEQTHSLEPDLGIGPDVDVQFTVHAAP